MCVGRTFVLIVVLAALLPGQRDARAEESGPSDKRLSSRADRYLTALSEATAFSGTVLITRNGKAVFEHGYGFANRELSVLNTPETKYQIGSMTEQFTAVLVLRLIEQGRLAITDVVCPFVRGCPKAWSAVTVQALLTHTSGIPDFTTLPEFEQDSHRISTPLETLKRVMELPLRPAGSDPFRYSTSDYVLLGHILEKVTGKPFERLLHEEILDGLGLKNTGYVHGGAIIEQRADGYVSGPQGLEKAEPWDESVPHAAAGMYSTADDLSRWEQVLATDKLISKKSLELIFPSDKPAAGYGWRAGKMFNRRLIRSTGHIPGFACSVTRFPDDHVDIFVLSNVLEAPVEVAAHELAAIAFGEKYTVPGGDRRTLPLDAKLVHAYVGDYEIEPGNVMHFSMVDNRLAAIEPPGGTKPTELRAVSESEFFFPASAINVSFTHDHGGAVTGFVLHDGEREIKATRKQ